MTANTMLADWKEL